MAQQPSIRSFFQPRQQPKYAAPPSSSAAPPTPLGGDTNQTTSQPPPSPPPFPPQAEPSQPTATLIPADFPVLATPPSLPVQASIVPVVAAHIPALRRINSLLLPVAYPDSFYTKALDPLASGFFSRSILWQDDASSEPKVIGGIVCRLEPNPLLNAAGQPRAAEIGSRPQQLVTAPDTPYHAIYIQSLALLSPYRSQGLAAAALEHIIASAAILPDAGSSIDVRTIYAHVWTENVEGLKWYEARGFRREGSEPVQGYYFKLRPDTAWIIRRDIGPGAPAPAPLALTQWQSAWPTSSAPTAGVPARSPDVNGGTMAAAVNLPPISSSLSVGASTRRPSATPSSSASSLSFQNARPETEWNDLPADMVGGGPTPGKSQLLAPSSGPGSTASSRSSSAVRKKKDRAYPSAAFGS
jgi:N-alpha-acetyltransferase 50